MRARTIGRWVGRAAVFAALAVGFLALGGTAANADTGDNPGAVVPMGIEWG